MRKLFSHKPTREACHIYKVLKAHAPKKHLSFHTPGHKQRGYDITELSYSDNLCCPKGCIAEAERDITRILGSAKSFILTDGSTCGVLCMLHSARAEGVKRVLVSDYSHKSVKNGCALLGLEQIRLPQAIQNGIPTPISVPSLTGEYSALFQACDAVLITSPSYYGDIPDLPALSALCQAEKKLLLIDGAHGGHLHFDKEIYAGAYADYWVDGVHKSLPALTQGAVVSAKTAHGSEFLRTAVDIFRTSSPSYPIMASVEYAVKYPKNTALAQTAQAFKGTDRVYQSRDWTKLCVQFGKNAYKADKELEKQGIYSEFCDGEYICFYLSPATKTSEFKRLKAMLYRLLEQYPYQPSETQNEATMYEVNETEWVELSACEGRICAKECGLFPPCLPLLIKGERVTAEKIEKLTKANGVYGLKEGKMLVKMLVKK